MEDTEDIQLKAEIDEIMNNVDSIMKKVEAIVPKEEKQTANPEN